MVICNFPQGKRNIPAIVSSGAASGWRVVVVDVAKVVVVIGAAAVVVVVVVVVVAAGAAAGGDATTVSPTDGISPDFPDCPLVSLETFKRRFVLSPEFSRCLPSPLYLWN